MATMENRVRAFIFRKCNLQALRMTEADLTLEFWQQFFKQASAYDDQIHGDNIRSFLRKYLDLLTDDMFIFAWENRMNFLCMLRSFCYHLCYIRKLEYFGGLAYDMDYLYYKTGGRFDDDVHEARKEGLSSFDTEVKITLKYNNRVEYILLDRHTTHDIDRLIGFSGVKSDIVVLNLLDFWNYASLLISQEQLNALPEYQIHDIPEVFKARLRDRGLQF